MIFALAVGAAPALAQDSGEIVLKPKKPAAAKSEKKPDKKTDTKSDSKPASKPSAPKPAPATTASKTAAAPALDANAGIPPAERVQIRAALISAGDYSAASNGDDPFTAAVKSFQKRNKSKVTGALTAAERATLVAQAKENEEEFGWRMVDDAATGARIGIPSKMLPIAGEARGGSRWSSRHGDVAVETFKIKEPDVTLASLFERQKKEPATRKVEFSSLRGDSFIVSGLQGLKKFSVRAHVKDGEVRGFTMLFDQAVEGIIAPIATTMASTFAPFPAPGMQLASVAARKVEYATAMIVSASGHLLTDRKAAENCQVIVAAGLGNTERIAEDKTSGLALLRVYGANKLTPVVLTGEAAQGTDATLVGVPEPQAQDGDKAVMTASARVIAGGTTSFLQPAPVPGFSGGAVLDRQGRLFGMVAARNAVVASASGANAPQAALVPTDAIKIFLAAHKVAPATGAPSLDAAKASVVRVICVRK
jgi:hypothetical protein